MNFNDEQLPKTGIGHRKFPPPELFNTWGNNKGLSAFLEKKKYQSK